MSNISTRIAILACLFVVVTAMLVAAPAKGDPFQCVSGSNTWKNDAGGIYTAPDGYTIASVWVKAGQNCYELPHVCYEIVSGGIGYNYIEVVDTTGDCQDLSHLEGTFVENEPTPTMTQEPTETPTNTPDPTETPTDTPEPSITPTITPTPTSEITPTPYPTKECQIEDCNGLG